MMNFNSLTEKEKANGTLLLEMLEPYKTMIGFPSILADAIKYNAECEAFDLTNDGKIVTIEIRETAEKDSPVEFRVIADLTTGIIKGEKPLSLIKK